jgi:hypothetical protein
MPPAIILGAGGGGGGAAILIGDGSTVHPVGFPLGYSFWVFSNSLGAGSSSSPGNFQRPFADLMPVTESVVRPVCLAMLCTGVLTEGLGAAGAGGGGGRLTTGGRTAGAAWGCFHVGGGAGAPEGAALAAAGPPKVFRRFATEKGTFPLTAGSSPRLLLIDMDFIPAESA